jgi:hypothetical protein
LTAVLVASTACGYGMGETAGLRPAAGADRQVQLNVTNRSGGPMEVYAAGSGTEYRIGTVLPGLAGRFVLRPNMVVNGTVELMARSATEAVVRSGPMLLRPGDVVDFDLTPNAVTSTATVRAWKPSRGR